MPIRKMLLLSPDLYQELEELTANGLQQMFANIILPFRPDLAPEHIINLIRWTIDGWSNETIAALQNQDLDYDWDTGVIDFREPLAILRKYYIRRRLTMAILKVNNVTKKFGNFTVDGTT